MLFPVVALGISTAYEGYRWSVPGLIGAMLIITGNLIVLKRRSIAGRPISTGTCRSPAWWIIHRDQEVAPTGK